jgi:uridylate kinase
MSIIVQKYGGSSVADLDRIGRVAARIRARREAGDQLVVVVSAMGDTTDELLELAKRVSTDPPRRELDMLLTCGERISMALLSMCLHELGVPAISFTGSQSGIITDDSHSQARIVEVRPVRILEELGKAKVVIVAGYQGVSRAREVTTLGRGGSDTTAVALAAALQAEACEIYSDVDGVFSADPRVVPEARKLESLDYETTPGARRGLGRGLASARIRRRCAEWPSIPTSEWWRPLPLSSVPSSLPWPSDESGSGWPPRRAPRPPGCCWSSRWPTCTGWNRSTRSYGRWEPSRAPGKARSRWWDPGSERMRRSWV